MQHQLLHHPVHIIHHVSLPGLLTPDFPYLSLDPSSLVGRHGE